MTNIPNRPNWWARAAQIGVGGATINEGVNKLARQKEMLAKRHDINSTIYRQNPSGEKFIHDSLANGDSPEGAVLRLKAEPPVWNQYLGEYQTYKDLSPDNLVCNRLPRDNILAPPKLSDRTPSSQIYWSGARIFKTCT